jgi:AmmeMemoRadiSam system protein B
MSLVKLLNKNIMPIVFTAITPHPPVLIPDIGKDHLEKVKKTEESMKRLEQDFYVSKAESIVIISPHGNVLEDAFTINLNADYKANFKDFGDFSLELSFRSDYMTIQEIRAADESNQESPIVLTSNQEIDYGFSVPLYFLTQHAKNIPIIPITYSALDYESHYKFGQFLHRQLSKINKRFAVIASGDLSHTLTKEAPGGFQPEAEEFDKKIVEQISNKDFAGIMKTDQKLAHKVGECGLRSIVTLGGLLEELNATPELFSYESPFGVGYAVANFKLA